MNGYYRQFYETIPVIMVAFTEWSIDIFKE